MSEPLAEAPRLDPASARLYVLIAIALVVANLFHASRPKPSSIPPELRAEYVPPPNGRVEAPWGIDADAERGVARDNRAKEQARLEAWRASAAIAAGDVVEARVRAGVALSLDPNCHEAQEALREAEKLLGR